VSGEVIDINKTLEETPELINQDSFGEGWLARLKPGNAAEVKSLLNAADYEALIKEEKH
jgi:glycine cleavage system H protein